MADAEELLAHHCLRPALAKTRYFVRNGQDTWHVDVYHGILTGVVIAEIELPSETAVLELPPWAGREVTGLPEFKKRNMVSARLAEAQFPN